MPGSLSRAATARARAHPPRPVRADGPSRTAPPGPDPAAFRTAMGAFPTGVTLLTCGRGASTAVITLNSLTAVSLDPVLLLVSVKSDGRMLPLLHAEGAFAVNVLTAEQDAWATHFSRPDRSSGLAAVRRLGAVTGPCGQSVVPSAAVRMECTLHAAHPAGDHTLLIGRVTALAADPAPQPPAPLVFHRGRYARLAPAGAPPVKESA
ncbi:flavin reductase family protein [Streptomyces sp. NPDC087440]|uniref:flavin reductase family protein n=1 Tax=Streptomyces sp. NPDC087440 TaxID=3365790 RepID=UPI0038016B45